MAIMGAVHPPHQRTAMKRHHHYRSPWKRGAYSLVLVVSVMTVGTVGMHVIQKMSCLDAFYFMSMIATAQGPPAAPATPAGKLFASFMAFISVGTVVASVGFLFGPFFGRLWRIGVERLEEETHLPEQRDEKR